MTPEAEIEVLDPPRRTLYLAGEEIAVAPLTIGQVGPVQRVLSPLLAELRAASGDRALEFELQAFVLEHTDEAVAVAAIAIDRPREWVARLFIDDFVELASAVFEINLNFFNRRLVASLERLTTRLQAAAGSISSPTSSPPAMRAGM
jgi:hypothetical protein